MSYTKKKKSGLVKELSFTGLELADELRKVSIKNITNEKVKFNKNWKHIKKKIQSIIGQKIEDINGEKIFNLGDSLREVFMSLLPKEQKNKRKQSDLAIGGDGWERLIGWYLNLCTINTRAIIFKKKNEYFSDKILNAVTVDIKGHQIQSESDLIGLVIPDDLEFKIKEGYTEKNFLELFRKFTDDNYTKFELFLIQCKTNFADDVERPLLYQILYSLPTNLDIGIKIGFKGIHVNDFKNFKYSFITVPTQKKERIPKAGSAPVVRASLFSGGHYWGMSTIEGAAKSLKEFISVNFSSIFENGKLTIIDNLDKNIKNLINKYKYFKLFD